MPTPNTISVIVTSWHKKELTKKCVDSFLQSKAVTELIVVDNASTDGTLEMLSAIKDPRLRVIKNSKNNGFSTALNQGHEAATSEYVLFTQNDVFIEPTSLDNIISLFNSLHRCGSLGVGGGFLSAYKIYEASLLNGDNLEGYSKVKDFSPFEVDFVAGFFVFARREDMLKNSIKWDPGYDPYWEDVDISFQFKKAGFKNYMVPRSMVSYIHVRSASITPLLGATEREKRREASFERFKSKWPSSQKDRDEFQKYLP